MNQFTKSSDYNLSFPDGEENYINFIIHKNYDKKLFIIIWEEHKK